MINKRNKMKILYNKNYKTNKTIMKINSNNIAYKIIMDQLNLT